VEVLLAQPHRGRRLRHQGPQRGPGAARRRRRPAQIVVVDNDLDHIADASDDGIAAVHGDGTRADVLRRADVEHAVRVVVAVPRDDAAVLVTLTVRRHNPTAYVVAAVRESENAPLLRDGGANGVVVSSEAAGRLLGVAAASPSTGAIFEDLLVPGAGLELQEREVLREEVGLPPRACRDLVVAILRDGTTRLFHNEQDLKLRRTDRVVVVRPAQRQQLPGTGPQPAVAPARPQLGQRD
jgi:voltage-gated potassium channel